VGGGGKEERGGVEGGGGGGGREGGAGGRGGGGGGGEGGRGGGGGGVCFSGMSVNIESCRQRLQRIMIMYGGMGSLRFYKVCENTFSSGNYMLFRYEHSVPGREEPCLAHGIGSKVMSVTSAPQ